MNWLDRIIENKRREVARWKVEFPVGSLPSYTPARPDFARSLISRPVGLIAEVKRRSPSAGPIREPFDPSAVASAYERGGAQALSVLMDREFFGGGPEDFAVVRASVSLPLLYKEFVVDSWQVHHAASIGASAVLLIVAALSSDELSALMREIEQAGLQALVEVHDESEAKVAVDAGARIIGINNRDLKTFVTSLDTTERVMKVIPADRIIVSESGIRTAEDVRRLQAMGIHAILVGEHLLRKQDLEAAVKDLMGPVWTSL